VNQLLRQHLGHVPWITYCDFGAAFRLPDGTVNAVLYRDGVHVTADGYAILGAKIRPELLMLAQEQSL
jgi:lysophospholipase L1-like esterase